MALITLNEQENLDILEEIFNNEITIQEDIQGSKIWVSWTGEEFLIRQKSLKNDPINLVDLAMQNFYNNAVDYFNGLDKRVKSLLNKKWSFCFEYFPDEQPANIKYDRIPKNNLILTNINKRGKYSFDIDELEEYARLFDVDMVPIIFKGHLTETMKESIKYFLNTSESDLEYIFGERSFAYFFYKILNPNIKNSFLMNVDNYQENLQKLIIRVIDKQLSFELLNPLYERMNDTNNTEFVEVYTLILVNFLNFSQSLNISDLKIKGNNKEEMYIYLICNLFNMYVSEIKSDLLNFDFIVPKFFDKDKFKINTELLKNKMTIEYINESDKLEYIFKVILGSFNTKKRKKIGIFTDQTVIFFNNFVDVLNDHIEETLGRIHERELNKKGLLDFGNYFDIKYDSDGEGMVYPDVYDEFTKGDSKKKKDKGKMSFGDKLNNKSI